MQITQHAWLFHMMINEPLINLSLRGARPPSLEGRCGILALIERLAMSEIAALDFVRLADSIDARNDSLNGFLYSVI